MSKQPENSETIASGSEDLFERLKAAANDVVLLREIVESSDSVSIAAAFAMLFAGGCSSASDVSTPPTKTRTQACSRIPTETFIEIVLFVDRDVLDALQLVCRFLFKFIEDRGAEQLPLRSIARVQIGKSFRRYWLPFVEVVREVARDRELNREDLGQNGPSPKTVGQLVSYLRLTYCESVCVDLRWRDYRNTKHRTAAHHAIFGDLVVSNAFVNVLTVCVDERSEFDARFALEAFMPLGEVFVNVVDCGDWSHFSDEAFFISAAKRGVRSIKFASPNGSAIGVGVLPAISFGLAEPTSGGDRILRNVDVGNRYYDQWYSIYNEYGYRFLPQLIKSASKLDGRLNIDLKFTICGLAEHDDLAGFEKYQKGKSSWLINDLENGITLEVVEANRVIEVHVFSSA
ncbi:hypothetical protein AAVH_06793 [Aphelenchoides avenae]|nr:hypothetical protein AAVH_06793 [Aphelenchus avenae]